MWKKGLVNPGSIAIISIINLMLVKRMEMYFSDYKVKPRVRMSNSDNEIQIIAKKAREGTFGKCHITVKEGEKLVVYCELKKEKGSFRLELVNKENGEELKETFKASETYEYKVSPGEYTGQFTFDEKGTTGGFIIEAVQE